jgi:hypothetical protein
MPGSSTQPRHFPVLQFIRNTVFACLGAALVASVLHARGPMATPVTLDRERVEKERKSCEVLFVGPSYVIAQIIPRAFDAEAKRLGRPLHACIFGATGMRGTELRVHMQELLRRKWPRLKLIVVDITLGHDPRFDEVNWYQPRFIQWHTFDSMPWILDYYRSLEGPVQWSNLRAHGAHLVANYTNLGVGLERLSTLGVVPHLQLALGRPAKLPESDAVRSYRKALGQRKRIKKEQARVYIRRTSPARHAANVAALVRQKHELASRGATRESAFPDALRALAREHKKDVFFIHAPVWRPTPPRAAPVPNGKPIVLYDFNDPERYPSLYTPKSRGRTHHVSWYGGIEYSKVLAHAVLEHRARKASARP